MGRNTKRAGELANLSGFEIALARADTLEDVTDLRSKAEALRILARNAGEGFLMQNRAAELRLRAERKAGRMLAALRLHGGDRKSNGHRDRLKLSDLGVSQTQSKRWQKEARIAEEDFERFIKVAYQCGEEITTKGLLRLARNDNPGTFTRNETLRTTDAGSRTADDGQCTTNRSRTHSSSSEALVTRKLTRQLLETVNELEQHCATLKGLVNPMCDGPIDGKKRDIQRRAIVRYFGEIDDLISSMKTVCRRADEA